MAGESIIIASGKGGVGKTTTTIGLALAADSIGLSVLVIDTDPAGIISGIIENAGKKGISYTFTEKLDNPILHKCAEQFDLVLVDSPPIWGDINPVKDCTPDLFLIPITPSLFDLSRLNDFVLNLPENVKYCVLGNNVFFQRGVTREFMDNILPVHNNLGFIRASSKVAKLDSPQKMSRWELRKTVNQYTDVLVKIFDYIRGE